jgi:hypothetical protein
MTVELRSRPDTDLPPGHTEAALSPAVQELDRRIREAEELQRLQGNRVLLDVLSDDEMAANRQVAEKVRAAGRKQAEATQLAAVERAGREQATADELAEIEANDKIDAARAGAQCRRLTEPGSRLAALYRIQRWVSRVMLALVIGGICWMAVNVHNAAVDAATPLTDPSWWLTYLVDPLINVPLVILLVLRGVAARYGDEGTRFGGVRIVLLEIGLLTLSAGLNLSGVIGHHITPAMLVSHVTPPAMVALVVVMYAPVMTFLGHLVAAAFEQAQAALRPAHLTDVETTEAQRVGQALMGIRTGELPLGEDGLPSKSAVERYLRQLNGQIAKAHAQRVAELIHVMFDKGLTA